MWIIIGAVVVPLMIAAMFLLQGKGSFLISGFNMMSPQEKATYDTEALCRTTGKFLIGLSGLMLLLPVSLYFNSMTLFYIVFAVIMAFSIGYAIYANTGNRFRVADFVATPAARKPMSRVKKATIFFAIIVSISLCGGLVYMFVAGEAEPVVTVHSDSIEISGMYGLVIPFDNISDIWLFHKSMREIGIGSRMNGFGGNALKGHFRSDELGAHRLFVFPDSPSTIQIIRHRGEAIYFSFNTNLKTVALYNEILAALADYK